MNIGAAIAMTIVRNGKKRTNVALEAGVDYAVLSRVIAHDQSLQLKTLVNVCSALGVDILELFALAKTLPGGSYELKKTDNINPNTIY